MNIKAYWIILLRQKYDLKFSNAVNSSPKDQKNLQLIYFGVYYIN